MKVRTKKKAFTIVELVVVIAVIAVLAAVLIPTFSNIIKKAQKSSDTQLVRNLNTALTVDGEEHNTMYDALQAAKDAGYLVDKINATETDNEILWDSVNDVFCYLEKGETRPTYIPETTLKVAEPALVAYWQIARAESDLTDCEYSSYLAYEASGEITTTKGIDVGNNTGVTKITYIDKDAELKSVDMRVNGNTKVDVKAEDAGTGDDVTVYGQGTDVDGQKVANTSLHIRGNFPTVYINTGRVVFEQDATTNVVVVTGTDAIIGYSEALPVEKHPEAQRLAGVNRYKVQETRSEDSTMKGEEIVVFPDDAATVPTITAVSGTVSEAIKNNQGTAEKPAVIVSEDAINNSSKFAGGLGTEKSPYLIANATQFKNMINEKYHALISDFIILKDTDITSDGIVADNKTKSLYLDGRNHKINVLCKESANDNISYLFYFFSGVIENITIINNTSDSFGVAYIPYGTVVLNNVNLGEPGVSNKITTYNNCGGLTGIIYEGANISFIDCSVYYDYEESLPYSNQSIGIFVGGYIGPNATVNFTRCKYYGTLKAGYAGMLLGNGQNIKNVTVTDCSLEGWILGTSTSGMFARNSSYDESYSNISNCVKNYYKCVLVQDDTLALTKNEQGKFVITEATKEVDEYVITFVGYANIIIDGENSGTRITYYSIKLADLNFENNQVSTDIIHYSMMDYNSYKEKYGDIYNFNEINAVGDEIFVDTTRGIIVVKYLDISQGQSYKLDVPSPRVTITAYKNESPVGCADLSN